MFEEMTYEKILQDVLDNAPDGAVPHHGGPEQDERNNNDKIACFDASPPPFRIAAARRSRRRSPFRCCGRARCSYRSH